MLKKLWVFGALICVLQQVNAQKKQDITFYKKNQKVSSKDSADFIRVVQEPDSGGQYLDFLEFYSNGSKKAQSRISWDRYPQISFEGQYLSYHRNGKKKSTFFYENNRITGSAYYFFEDGTLWKTIEHLSTKTGYSQDTLVNYLADSLGNVMVKDGNGHITERSRAFGGSVFEGDYKDGLKHGYWTMKADSGECWYRNLYEKGKFISGESEKDGLKTSYTEIESLPVPKGGMQSLYSYLKWAIKYPKDAWKNNIQGKVYLTFTVEKDGSIANVEVKRSLYPSLDNEAMRVIRQAPKWIPGRQNGFPVKVKYNIPISFSL